MAAGRARSRVAALLLLAGGLGLGAADLFAQETPPPGAGNKPDPRVRRALESAGLKYEVDRDGDFRVVFAWEEDGRSQLVFVNSITNTLGGEEIREVWSEGWRREGDSFPPAVCARLMEANADYTLGAWELRRSGGSTRAVFTARVGAGESALHLAAVVAVVAAAADEMEKELLGSDTL